MKQISKEVKYINHLCSEIQNELRVIEDEMKQSFIYASPARARYKRLRVELTKQLLKLEKEIYKV